MGLCMRKPKKETKTKNKLNLVHFTPTNTVLGSLDLKTRTQEYYSTFAADTLENDIEKEMR